MDKIISYNRKAKPTINIEEGTEYVNNRGDVYTIINYVSSKSVKVRFKDSGYTKITSVGSIKSGEVGNNTETNNGTEFLTKEGLVVALDVTNGLILRDGVVMVVRKIPDKIVYGKPNTLQYRLELCTSNKKDCNIIDSLLYFGEQGYQIGSIKIKQGEASVHSTNKNCRYNMQATLAKLEKFSEFGRCVARIK